MSPPDASSFTFAGLLATACAHRTPTANADAVHWSSAGQMVLVTTADWDATTGTLRYYERDGANWRQVGSGFDVTVGRSGTAWGIGLHTARSDGPVKREGDGKAPAGVFAIGTAFGYAIFVQHPDAISAVGMAIVVASGLSLALRERRRMRLL